MSKSINELRLLGNVGKEPEIKATSGGTNVTKFSLATTSSRKDADGNWQDETTWHNIIAFGKMADVIEKYVHKGDRLYIEGRISNRSWEKDGQTHYMTEVLVNDVVLLAGRQNEPLPTVSSEPQASNEITEVDLPF